MTVEEWVKMMSRQGGVCTPYMRKIAAASNKTEMFRVLCDVNGGAWLFDLHANGVPLPIEQFMKEYAAYVNGKKTVCKARVYVPMNRYPTLILSHGTEATVQMGVGSRMNIELYGGAKYTLGEGDKSKVRVTQH